MYKLTGTIKLIKDTVQISDSFSKREFVINDGAAEYPQDVSFQSVQDKCAMLDKFGAGETVEVSFNLRGREWTSPQGEVKHFNTLDAWRIEAVTDSGLVDQEVMSPNTTGVTEKEAVTAEDDDDLPF
jgi:hypothetical protein